MGSADRAHALTRLWGCQRRLGPDEALGELV